MGEKIIFGGIGIVIGFAAGFVLGRRSMRSEVDRQVNEIIDEIKSTADKELNKSKEDLEKKADETIDKIRKDHEDLYKDATKAYKEYSAKSEHEEKSDIFPDPAELMSPEDDDEEDELDREIAEEEDLIRRGGLVTSENENEIAGMELTAEMDRKPRLITDDEFDNGKREYDKIQLVYYTGDDVLIEADTEEEVIDIQRVVGDCLDKYGFRSPDSDEETIFVRNYAFGCDYEISKIHGYFIDPEEP